jgi:hypothetical protein
MSNQKWNRIAEEQFAALDKDMQQDWADLHDKVASRS